jgi:serine/threonine protein kinase
MDYIAPEQARDASTVGPAADIYALGCSLYYAVTGTVPFPGGSARDKIRRHQTTHPEEVTLLNPAIPAEFDHLLAALMGKRPKDRPATAADVATLLAGWADPVPANPAADTPKAQDIIRMVEDRWQSLQANLEVEIDDEPVILDDPADAGTLPVAPRLLNDDPTAATPFPINREFFRRFRIELILAVAGLGIVSLISGFLFWLTR